MLEHVFVFLKGLMLCSKSAKIVRNCEVMEDKEVLRQ